MEDYQQLYSFLPYFQELHDNRKKAIPQKKPFFIRRGMMDITYAEEMGRFIETVNLSGFIDKRYSNTLYKYGVEDDGDMEAQLAFADKALLRAILTQMIRSERFLSGAWIVYEEKGMFLKALQRLGELYGYSMKEGEKLEE